MSPHKPRFRDLLIELNVLVEKRINATQAKQFGNERAIQRKINDKLKEYKKGVKK